MCHACQITTITARIRPATESDLDRINDIYNQYIVDSHVVFDLEPWDLEQRRTWWERYASGEYVALVAEVDEEVVGVAYSTPWRDRAAYASSVQTTVMLDDAFTGQGIGAALLTAILEAVVASGAHRAYAIVALPNDPSVALHMRLGYQPIGVLDEVGHKMGRYWSTVILENRLN